LSKLPLLADVVAERFLRVLHQLSNDQLHRIFALLTERERGRHGPEEALRKASRPRGEEAST